MCVLTTAAIAGGLTAIGATSAAASATAVAATTIAANAVLGAGMSAGLGAATGARGRDLWTAAAIGGATAGIASGAGMAVSGISTMSALPGTTAQTGAAHVISNTGGILQSGSPLSNTLGVTYGQPSSQVVWHTAEAASTEAVAAQTAAAAGQSASPDLATYGMMALQGGMGAVEGYSAYQEGKETAKELKKQAELDKIRASQAQEAAAIEKMDFARKQNQLKGAQRTAAAANGIMLESRAESSPSMFEQDTASELAWESAKIDYNANLEAWGYMQNARTKLRQASAARKTGNLKMATGLIRGGLGMASTYYMGTMRASHARLYA